MTQMLVGPESRISLSNVGSLFFGNIHSDSSIIEAKLKVMPHTHGRKMFDESLLS